MQIYIVVMGAYYAYKYYKGGDAKDSGANSAAKQECKDDPELRRRFTKTAGTWTSYLEAGSCSATQLLLLHQTSLSAETEFGSVIPQLLTAAPAGGLKVLAVDRPCHGYSLCPEGGEPEEISTFLRSLLAGRSANFQVAYMASGREAARHALATVQRRQSAARILLIRPHSATLDTRGMKSRLAAADVSRWSALSGKQPSSKAKLGDSLDVASLPRGCTVTLIYFEGDEEDENLKTTLEDENIPVEVRWVDSIEDGIAPAVADMLAGEGAATADASDEEV